MRSCNFVHGRHKILIRRWKRIYRVTAHADIGYTYVCVLVSDLNVFIIKPAITSLLATG